MMTTGRISRRTNSLLAGAGFISIGIGYAAVRSFSDEDLVRATLEKHLGDLNITADHLRRSSWNSRSEIPGPSHPKNWLTCRRFLKRSGWVRWLMGCYPTTTPRSLTDSNAGYSPSFIS